MTTAIEEKLQALCQAIVADSEIKAARDQAEAFLADEDAVGLFRELMTKSNEMRERQHHGEDIDDEEVSQLMELKAAADGHAGIRSFHQAQDVLQGMVEMVNGFVTKTLENGDVPTRDQVMQKGCGTGCGCH